ncbi:MAG: VOC family protein, partial [Solirubrobacteraceae bacterium]
QSQLRLRAGLGREARIRRGDPRQSAAATRRSRELSRQADARRLQALPGGWNRIHFVVDDITAEMERLRGAGVHFRNELLTGPGGRQVLLDDPSGNPIELFQPTATR